MSNKELFKQILDKIFCFEQECQNVEDIADAFHVAQQALVADYEKLFGEPYDSNAYRNCDIGRLKQL